MQEIHNSAGLPTISTEKVVATPTLYSWSQTYSAGTLFAVVSLVSVPEKELATPLNVLGKTILQNLEAEYFTLERKELASITKAALAACQETPEDVSVCLVVATIIGNILYCTALGGGKVVLKRNGKTGVILNTQDKERTSGFLQDADIIVLETHALAENITDKTLSDSLQNTSLTDIAETLSLAIHTKAQDATTALIVAYATPKEKEEDALEQDTPEEIQPLQNEQPLRIHTPPLLSPSLFTKIKRLRGTITLPHIKFPKRTVVFLGLFIILAVVLTASVLKTIQSKEDAKNHAVFLSFYDEAQKQYDEGESLATLNKNLARDDFLKAQKLLTEGNGKLKPNSVEQQQTQALLQKVNDALQTSLEAHALEAKPASDTDNKLLASYKSTSGAVLATQDNNTVYIATGTNITAITKETQQAKELVKKDWDSITGIGTYNGNIYILDSSKNQISKFTAVGSSYAKSNYLTAAADVSDGKGLAVDGSIYILKGGGIVKFTKGAAEAFTIQGLDKPFSNPTSIVTDADMTNIYVLDAGNSRVVILKKDGSYIAQYSAPILQGAKVMDVNEKEKTIFVLSGGKIYKLSF